MYSIECLNFCGWGIWRCFFCVWWWCAGANRVKTLTRVTLKIWCLDCDFLIYFWVCLLFGGWFFFDLLFLLLLCVCICILMIWCWWFWEFSRSVSRVFSLVAVRVVWVCWKFLWVWLLFNLMSLMLRVYKIWVWVVGMFLGCVWRVRKVSLSSFVLRIDRRCLDILLIVWMMVVVFWDIVRSICIGISMFVVVNLVYDCLIVSIRLLRAFAIISALRCFLGMKLLVLFLWDLVMLNFFLIN